MEAPAVQVTTLSQVETVVSYSNAHGVSLIHVMRARHMHELMVL